MSRYSSMMVLAATALAITFAVPSPAIPHEDHKLKAKMDGHQEAPVCATTGTGTFAATISEDESSVSYELAYDLQGATVQQAHIHLGQRNVSGGITVWLCQTPLATPPFTDPTGLAPTCPDTPGTVTGTFTRLNVSGPANQGIAGGPSGATAEEFAQLIREIRARKTYANVHSNICPAGEVRGQIK